MPPAPMRDGGPEWICDLLAMPNVPAVSRALLRLR